MNFIKNFINFLDIIFPEIYIVCKNPLAINENKICD